MPFPKEEADIMPHVSPYFHGTSVDGGRVCRHQKNWIGPLKFRGTNSAHITELIRMTPFEKRLGLL